MKVKELIEQLSKVNPELTVYVPTTEEHFEEVTSCDESELITGDDEDSTGEIVVCILNVDREA